MTTDVGIRVGVDGEKEFKSSLAAVNAQLRNLNSEMQSTVAAFAGMEDSEEAVAASSDVLQRSISAQRQKLTLLSGQYDRSNGKLIQLGDELDHVIRKFGENSKEASKAQNAYNRQAAEVNNLGSQVNKATADLRALERQFADVGKSADELSDDLDDVGREFTDFGEKMKGAIAGGVIVGSLTGIADGINNIVNESLEYNKIMGTLEVSSLKAGYSAEQTAASYMQLYGVIGDEQQAATALANLQALGLEQEQLVEITDGAIGAWVTYGDSIPIDSLSEAINETIQAGVVTGTFADVLNWAGTNEDDFNEKLSACSKKSERVRLVMDELSKQQLPGAAAGWRENNAELVKLNEANANLSAAMGDLGIVFTPLVTMFKNGLATIISGFVGLVGTIDDALDRLSWLYNAFNKAAAASNGINLYGGSDQIDGSHANGLAYVPYDGYIAQLHKGERVLTATENKTYGQNGYAGSITYGDINLFIDKVDNSNGRSIETMAKELEFYRRQQTGGRGGRY